MADEDSNDQYREFAPGLQTAPARSAPDLYEAMGGRLTTLNDQLAGFQNELAGMSVPAPNIVPPDVTSGIGQVGSVLADMFSPMAGIKNPVTEKQEAYRAQQMEATRERRSILQQRMGVSTGQLAILKAQLELEKEREEQADAPLKFVPGLLSIKTPAALQMAGNLLQDAFARKGIPVPEGFAQGLINKEYSFKDMGDIATALAMGHDPAVVKQMYPNMSPEVFASIASKKIPDHLMKAVNPHWKTEVEREKEAAELVLKTGEIMDKARARQGLGGGSTNTDIIHADKIHRLDNNGKLLADGTPLSQAMAMDKWDAQKLAAEIDKKKAEFGILAPLKAAEDIDKQNRKIVSIDGGKGTAYNRKTNEFKQRPTELDMRDPAWIAISKKDYDLQGMMTNAIEDARRLKTLIPQVLSAGSGDNLRQYAQNYLKGKLGGDKLLNEFFQTILKLNAEEARALGDSATIRMGLFDQFAKHANVKGYDTQGTALHMADQLIWTFANRRNRVLGLDIMHAGQRLGPGKFWASKFDPAVGVPDPNAPRKGIVLGPNEVSPVDAYIWESQ